MINFRRGNVTNTWEPPKINADKIIHECRYIKHEPQQDICVLLEKDEYIEAVICNEERGGVLHRFIVASDYYWTNEAEDVFDGLVQEENVAFSGFHFNSIYEKYSAQYPDWKLQKYYNKPLRLIDHIYNCLHKNSVKEILYKAGLDEIAAKINLIDEYNLIGSTPADILSGLNARLLKAINIPEGLSLIQEEWKRQKMYILQSRYSWMFEDKLNAALCKFLDKLICEEDDYEKIAKEFKANYKRLTEFWIDSQYSNYLSLLEQKKRVQKEVERYIDKKLLKELDDLQVRQIYGYMVAGQAEWDKKVEESNLNRNIGYEWRDEKFSVFFPKSIKEFVIEAIKQNNCLLEYVEEYVENTTDILFLRKVGEENKPFVTIEIYDGEIIQAYAKCNTLPDKDVQDWIHMYAKKIGVCVSEDCFCEQ